LAGTYDAVYVPRANINSVWQQPGIRCRYPLVALSVDALFFNFNTADGMAGQSPYVGNEVWGTGIPLNAFSNLNLRKAFTYSFNMTKFVAEQFLGEAFPTASPIVMGLAPYAPPPAPYPADYLDKWHIANRPDIIEVKAEYYFKLAWGGIDDRSGNPDEAVLPEDPSHVTTTGTVWNSGFDFKIVYNIGNEPRRLSDEMLRDEIKKINTKFTMTVVGVDWAQMLDEIWWVPTNGRSIIPIFTIGWLADFADAHNFAYPFMGTYGDFSFPQSYSNAQVDNWITQGIQEGNPSLRVPIYDNLNNKFVQEQIDIMGVIGLGRRWERDWVQGWYYSPILPGTNLYPIWKEDLPWTDVDSNGKVEIKDLAAASKAYGSYYIQPNLPPNPTGPPGYYTSNWDSRADVNQDMKVDIKDLARMAKGFGFVAPPWLPPP